MIKELLASESNNSMPIFQRVFCESVFEDSKLLEPLKDFDMLITDASMLCGNVLSDYLDIPRIEYCPVAPRMNSLLNPYEYLFTVSYLPQFLTSNPQKMNFFQRVKNTLFFVVGSIAVRMIMLKPLQDIKVKYNIKPERSIMESYQNRELVLYLSEFALEYACPMPPRKDKPLVFTSGANTRAKTKLSFY